jgi:small subunit ribosomal protein S1
VHHVDLPEQVVTPGEELWVKIIDIDLQRRRISLSIKQAAEGGEVSEEYREAFGEHAYDAEGNYIGPFEFAETEFTPETEAQAAWAEYVAEHGTGDEASGGETATATAPAGETEAVVEDAGAADPSAEPAVAAVTDDGSSQGEPVSSAPADTASEDAASEAIPDDPQTAVEVPAGETGTN